MISFNKEQLFNFAVVFALYIALFGITISPFKFYVSDNHWLGSEAGYSFWFSQGFQWGKDIVQNIGPLGFLHFPLSYTGINDFEKVVANFVLSAYLSGMVIYLFFYIKNRFIGALLLFLFISLQILKLPGWWSAYPYFNNYNAPTEVNHYLIGIFTVYVLFTTQKFLLVLFCSVVLALMSLGKGMFLFSSIFTIAATILNYVVLGKRSWALWVGCVYGVTTMVAWVMAGQAIGNFSTFLTMSFAFSAGYPAGLAQYPGILPLLVVVLPFILLVLVLIGKIFFHWKSGEWKVNASLLLLSNVEALLAFASYKHGITSEDSYHMQVYFSYTFLVVMLYLFVVPFRETLDKEDKKELQEEGNVKIQKGYMVSLLFLIFYAMMSKVASHNVSFIFNFNEKMKSHQVRFQKNMEIMNLSKIKNVVKDEAVTYFGELPGPMVYSKLNYKPTPTTISFVGWNKILADKEASYFHDSDALPKYLVLQLYNVATGAVAKQFSPLDGIYAQLGILRNYEPVILDNRPLVQNNRLLLQKRPSPTSPITFSTIDEIRFDIDDWIEVSLPKVPVLASIELDNRGISKVFDMLYKPPVYYLEFILDNGVTKKERFTPFKGKEGFLISPLVWNNTSFAAALSKDEWHKYTEGHSNKLHKIIKFRITCHNRGSSSEKIKVTYKALHGVPFGLHHLHLNTDRKGFIGTWLINGKVAHINVNNQGVLQVTNEHAMNAYGEMTLGESLIVPRWGVTAHLSKDKQTIIWSNGAEWLRKH